MSTPSVTESNAELIQTNCGKNPSARKPLAGRAINWLKNTSTGRLTLTIASGAAVGALALLTLALAVKGVATIVLGTLLCGTGVGIPIGLPTIAVGTVILAGALFAGKGTLYMFDMCVNNYQQMKVLSIKEAENK